MEFRIHRHPVVDSTNDLALAAVEAGTASHGDVHVARGQTGGRGRHGRRWESAPGEGLYASVVLFLPPPPPPPAALTIAGGLAALDAARELGAEGLSLKWPNDLLAGGEKLAGILAETRGLDHARPAYVLGLGFNVAQREFPAGFGRPATSLAMLGVEASPDDVLARFLPPLAERLEAPPAELAADFLSATGLAGREVLVRRGEDELRGRLAGLEIGAGLRLATPEGELRVPLAHATAVEALG